MGVPGVTLIGPTHVSRVGLSLLTSVGLSDLAADSPESFVETAVKLAGDLPRLAEMRTTLRDRMRASPLMDGARMARDVENAYQGMWEKWVQT